jgi:hypothetical protein
MLASPASPVASRACWSLLFSFALHVNGIKHKCTLLSHLHVTVY